MKHTVFKKAALKKKSEELGIPFSNLLAGYVLEQLMYLIADSPFSLFLWLRNGDVLGVEQYKKKSQLTLEFSYLTDPAAKDKGDMVPGRPLGLKMGYVMLLNILKEEKVPEVKWKGRATEKGGVVELEVSGEFEEMSVPIRMRIRELTEEGMTPVRASFPLMMEPEKRIPYLEYPSEVMLAENLFAILQKMELIPQMDAYDVVYQLLGSLAVDGRRVRQLLLSMCEKDGMKLEESRCDDVISYKKYAYMRKRWEKYLRGQKKDGPSWDEVMGRIESFLPRVWASICKDEIFFGDWMPELGRYLD